MVRACICTSDHPLLCGVCSLRGALREHAAAGRSPRAALFAGLDPARALASMRRRAVAARVTGASWHAFRRGMASDMLDSGAPLAQILIAGGWRSTEFLRYLIRKDADSFAACDFLLAQSDSE